MKLKTVFSGFPKNFIEQKIHTKNNKINFENFTWQIYFITLDLRRIS
jgi:hypothetical protein